MKLKLKHLTPYLPYGFLYGIYENQKVIIRGMNYNSDYLNIDFEINNHNKVSSTCFFNEIKPILRPLSDLTKEIEVNGEKFIPIDKINEYDETIMSYSLSFYTDCTLRLPYYVIKYLFEWHFDVFGLIEKGLAISYNEL
jgi:hypothetical protein